jgi:hypothetical protein
MFYTLDYLKNLYAQQNPTHGFQFKVYAKLERAMPVVKKKPCGEVSGTFLVHQVKHTFIRALSINQSFSPGRPGQRDRMHYGWTRIF